MLNTIAIIIYVALTSGGLIAIKIGTSEGQHMLQLTDKLAVPFNFPIILGVILYALSFLVYMFLISKFDLSYIIPIASALVYIIIFLAAFFVFKEPFTILKVTGIGLIVVGLMLLNIKGS